LFSGADQSVVQLALSPSQYEDCSVELFSQLYNLHSLRHSMKIVQWSCSVSCVTCTVSVTVWRLFSGAVQLVVQLALSPSQYEDCSVELFSQLCNLHCLRHSMKIVQWSCSVNSTTSTVSVTV
jgi:hypothetical protein